MIRKARFEDIADIVNIQQTALPHGLLSLLGKEYLTGYFYPTALASTVTTLLVAEENQRVAGFLLLAYSNTQFTKELGTHKLALLWALLRSSLKHIKILNDFLFTLFFSKIAPKTLSAHLKNAPEIYLIAVGVKNQGKNNGSKLLEAAMGLLRQKEFSTCFVKTKAPEAFNFYLKNGFKSIGKEQRGKNVFKILSYTL